MRASITTYALFLAALVAASVNGESLLRSGHLVNSYQCSPETLCLCNTNTGPKKLLKCPSTNGTHVIGVEGLKIVSIAEDAFEDIADALIIDLANNLLTELPTKLLYPVTGLESLSLQGNQLLSLPGTLFWENSNLKMVDLRFNKLPGIPSDLLIGHYKLHTLLASLNKISELDYDAFANTNLTHIDLYGNKLETLPKELFAPLHIPSSPINLVNLTANSIVYLPGGIFKDVSSEVIGISQNPGSKAGNCPQGTVYTHIKAGASQKFCMQNATPLPTPSLGPS